ncbi:hypothetical protein B9479_000942 [Cryptococcus floricola]|uniref:Barwin domain-containing protein n=1 Tax=Cryptococcus floricola TaxID=2591691 RepID=A0A5D3B7U0_9TREE|nr:hypothetical protein B9479_000942 [Cryptococcus floricola]
MFTKVIFAALAALSVVSAAPSSEKRDQSTGTATYYTANGDGACGWSITDDQELVAVNSDQYDASKCGQKIWVWNSATQRIAFPTVADECPTCSSGDLDMSGTLFAYLADGDMDQGVFDMKWGYF